MNDKNFRQVENEISEIVDENDESYKQAHSKQWMVEEGDSVG